MQAGAPRSALKRTKTRNKTKGVRFLQTADVHNALVVDETTQDAFLINTSMLQKSCVQRGKRVDQRYTILFGAVLGYASSLLVSSVWAKSADWTPLVLLNFFSFAIVAALAMIYLVWSSRKGDGNDIPSCLPWLPLGALIFFLLQFPWLFYSIASKYTDDCFFDEYMGGAGQRLRGVDIAGSRINGTVTLESSTRYVVDCEVKICIIGMCTNGGRMLFSMLAHSIPIVFALTYYFTIAKTMPALQLAPQIIDLLDIQAFFTLFLEDDVIRNYWGIDLCESQGCTGDRHFGWWFMMVILVSAIVYVTIITSLKIGAAIHNRYPDFDIPEELFASYATGEKAVVASAISSLAFIDVPFMAARCICSYRYAIVMSTMVTKNLFFATLAIAKIAYCGNIVKLLVEHPSLAMFMSMGEEITGETDDQPSASDEPNLVVGHQGFIHEEIAIPGRPEKRQGYQELNPAESIPGLPQVGDRVVVWSNSGGGWIAGAIDDIALPGSKYPPGSVHVAFTLRDQLCSKWILPDDVPDSIRPVD